MLVESTRIVTSELWRVGTEFMTKKTFGNGTGNVNKAVFLELVH